MNMTLVDFLRLVAASGATGAFIAFLFEKIPQFQSLSQKAKWWLVLGLSFGLPVLAQLVIQFVPPDVLAALEPYFQIVAAALIGWTSSQAVHIWHVANAPIKWLSETDECDLSKLPDAPYIPAVDVPEM